MSSDYEFINSLVLARIHLFEYGGILLIVLGTISCIISIVVFSKKTLRKNPCSIYFLALNIANFFMIYIVILGLTTESGFNLYSSAYNLDLCRFKIYTSFLFDILSPFYLILASIDRVLITSPNARTRQLSTRRLAYVSILLGTLFWVLFHIHGIIFAGIIQWTPDYSACYFQAGVYLIFTAYYSFLVKGNTRSCITHHFRIMGN